jgi:imidazolonepropionase-like amidohydrolase
LVVTQGDVFDSSSQVMAVLVGGQRLDAAMPERKKPEDLKADPPLALMPPINSVFPRPAETTPAHRLYRNATVWTMGRQGVLKGADVLIRDGKIVAVGRGLSAPQGCEVVDATGKHISPGIWDCHSHTAIWGGVNEGSNMVTIECRISDVINATSQDVYTQLSGGTVGAQQLHGSANAIGGQTSPVKWRWGQTADEFPIAGAPQGVKFALGQNPIREDTGGFGGQATVVGSTLLTWRPRTRMGVEESIRRALQLGREYVQAWADYKAGRRKAEPRRDLQLEGLGEITTGQCLVHSHAYRADEMLMLMRVVPEYGGRIASLQHVLEGYKIADEMAAAQVGGSTFSDWWGFKLESYDAIPHNPGLMAERGVSVSVNSDSGNHARRLNMEAAKSIRYAGTSPEKALSFVTIEPARQMGIGDKTGSLEPGKDADMVVWTDDPTSVFAVCLETYVDGVKRFDRADDARQRAERERELLAAKALLAEAAPAPAPAATTDEAFPTTAKFGIGPITGIPGSARYPRKAVFFDDATVHPMDGEPFVGDVLVGADGMIAAVGKELSPGGATRVNGRGKHLYPGLIDAVTGLGINEIGQVPASDDSSERGDFHPDYRVERTINPEWETLAVARNQGVLTALVRPSGSGASGQAALIHTEGYTWEDITVQGGVALAYGNPFGAMGFGEQDDRCLCEVIETDLGHEGHGHDDDFTSGAAQQQQGGVNAIGQTLTRIADQIKAAKAYEADLAAATPEKPVARDQRHEAILRVARGELPVLVSASTGAEIKAAVEWAEKEGIRMVITGGTAADEVDDWLAKKQVPIAFAGTMTVPPADRPVDHYYSLPARLAKAGVRFCLTTQSDKDVRLLRDQAGWAAAYGLPREDAARSITWWAAQVLGVDDRMGAIKPGLEGTVILTDGEIIEVRSRVLRAWIRGREVSLETKQTRLYDKYRTRPR